MVSKNQKKLIKSLYQKKYRKQHELFVAEGKKVIHELLAANLKLHSLFTTETSYFEKQTDRVFVSSEEELKSISFLSTPQVALAIFYIPKGDVTYGKGLTLVLDDVRDPGNLGTIIRLCDWFGVANLVCSDQTVDCYNPKVIQATMGSITRVHVKYTDVLVFLNERKNDLPIFGTFMDGNSIYAENLPTNGIIIMGNEANGISSKIENLVTHRVTIPQFGEVQKTESLNVATAAAIVLNEFRRR